MPTIHFNECGNFRDDSQIVVKENRREFRIVNNNRKKLLEVKVDGCLISIEGKRCDWLLIDIGSNHAYFIELKGCEIKEAFKQLENTIRIISEPKNGYIENEFIRKSAYVICSRSPLLSTEIQNEKKNFKKKLKTELVIHETKYTVNI